VSKGDHQHPETRQRRFREADPRLRNFLVSVILLTLREWNSYGYELMERMAAFGFEAINPGPTPLETYRSVPIRYPFCKPLLDARIEWLSDPLPTPNYTARSFLRR
jgi:hypothetical protein